MQYSRNKIFDMSFGVVICFATGICAADDGKIAPQDHSVESYQRITDTVSPDDEINLETELPSEDDRTALNKEESIEYLKNNPKEFEDLLAILLTQGNAEALKELLPIYQQVPNYDPSVIDWGNAIIASKEGFLDEGIKLYRKLNSKLPDVNVIRFQMAAALFFNQQFEASKSEFEKLRSNTTSEADIAVINKYLEAINNENNWDIYATVSYLNDDNITNSPKQGTEINNNGNTITYTSPRESGKGIDFYLSADKKWRSDNKFYTALHLNSFGDLYWDNEKFNDISIGVGAGLGYQNKTSNLELGPFYNKRWFGQGNNGDGDIHDYSDTKGLKLTASQWLSPKWRYQGLMRYGKTEYIDDYDHNDGKDFLFANSMIYLPNGKQNWIVGLDYSNKDTEDKSSSFNRKGVRLGWGQTWPKGFSTKLSLGYAERDYNAENFFGIKRENKEYSAGATFWKRDFSIYGLTPRFAINYFKVESNSPFEEYDKTNVSVELTKTF